MVRVCLGLIPLALLISMPLTALLIRASHRLGAYDSAGVPGQVKASRRRVPNTGGIALFWAIAVPIVLGVLSVAGMDASPTADWRNDLTFLPADLHEHVAGIQKQTPMAILLLGSLLLLHVLGLVDDRRPLGPWVKLAVMAVPATAIPLLFPDTRLLTLLDAPAGGRWASTVVTVLWFLVVTNAMNFMDNMDGLAAGVAAVASSLFLAATLASPEPQWFVAACLSLIVGACLGFLWFNHPARGPARVYMGDGGSLVIGFLLAFLTVRTTYVPAAGVGVRAGAWYGVLMPLVVLAVPLYDFASVVVIRLSQGRSPFVGDTQHLSHRLVRRGLSVTAAVSVIHGLTAVTGAAGLLLASSRPWQAVVIGGQVALILALVAVFEYASPGGLPRERSASDRPSEPVP
ncbi:MAG: undecaprenyl/decaprenyl-phosphate alpha-N-acetylglucosaminyl 1-phosphate transferase [Phycisphaerae bacterium]|nr:undecaprenyl/decaprenyl-phosphate alpha-N-acetylglucosaminyl 1-phosphate transferase [Phycisphaerae bacterium]